MDLKLVVLGFGSQVLGLVIGLVLLLMFGFGRFKLLRFFGLRLLKGSNLLVQLWWCNLGDDPSRSLGLSEVFDIPRITAKKAAGPAALDEDVASLREMVKAERRRAEGAWEEVERERRASGSAVQEVLGMILSLQTEKSRVEMEGRQYRRMAEERREFVEGVVEGLRRRVAAQEDEIRLLEAELLRATSCPANNKLVIRDDDDDDDDDDDQEQEACYCHGK